MGVKGIGPDWFHHVGRAFWQQRNPSVYRVYQRGGEIVGFLGLAPLKPGCADDLLAGRRNPWWDLPPDCLLEPRPHERARFFGCELFVDAYLRADAETEEQMRWDFAEELRRTHLRRLIAQSSDAPSEAACAGIGMVPALEGPLLPSGFHRRLWQATGELLERDDPLSTAAQPFLWYVFDEVRARFTPPPDGLRLTSREQEVAYLHYCEGRTAGEVAGILACRLETVRTHLRNIRTKAAEKLTPNGDAAADEGPSRRGTAIAAYLREHPGEVRAAGSVFAG
jgi:DNA-binding CsgD family transcriptional regulator